MPLLNVHISPHPLLVEEAADDDDSPKSRIEIIFDNLCEGFQAVLDPSLEAKYGAVCVPAVVPRRPVSVTQLHFPD